MELKSPAKAFDTRFWLGFALVALVAVTIAALFWIFDHPFGTNWDEARYINYAYKDVWSLRQDGLLGLAKSVMGSDRARPAAFRILVLPFTLLLGVSPQLLRIISFACLWVTVGLVFLAARSIAGLAGGAFAALFLIACPIIVAPNLRFYVDYPLYMAIAGMMYFLLADWQREAPSRWGWVGLGLALGLGAWSKPPIVFVAAPTLFLTGLLSFYQVIKGHTWQSLLKAVALGIGVMSPWWVINFVPTVKKAFRSSGFVAHSLGPRGAPETLLKWSYGFVQTMLGPALALLTLAILVVFLVRQFRNAKGLNWGQGTAILLGLAGAVPMLITGAFATNHNFRLIAPALVPLAITVGGLAAMTGWTTSRGLSAVATVLLGFQLTVMLSPSANDGSYQKGDLAGQTLHWGNPTTVMQRSEQWNWFLLKRLCDDRQLKDPLIAYLGADGAFNVPQIARPWVESNEPVRLNWLWNDREGSIDWNRLQRFVAASDVVLTAPNLVGGEIDRQRFDNQHNAEMAALLQNNPQFAPPIELQMGRLRPTQVLVFLRKPTQPPAPIPDEMRTNPFQ